VAGRRLLWLVWDAAAAWVVDRLLAEGAMPHLAHLAAAGVRAGLRPPKPNCQTPPALATLFTGTDPRQHGITGYAVADRRPGAGPLATRSGFEADLLRAEPVWRRAASSGRRVVLPLVPWTLPVGFDNCLLAVEAYSRRLARGSAVDLDELPPASVPGGWRTLDIAGHSLLARERGGGLEIDGDGGGNGDGNGDPGGLIGPAGRVLRLAPGLACHAWTYRRPPDGRLALAHTGVWEQRVYPEERADDFTAAAGPFCGEGLGRQYRDGRFGPRLVEGGDGRAEGLFWRSLRPCLTYFHRAGDWAVGLDAELYLLYLPYLDDIGHEILGWCDRAGRAYRPEVADALWRTVRLGYSRADIQLGRLQAALGRGVSVLVSSDHGMGAIFRLAHVNERLRRAGLLAFDARGGIDLSRTRVFYHPCGNGLLCVNGDHRPGGIVPPGERGAVLAAAVRLLRDWRDPDDGGAVVRGLEPGPGAGCDPVSGAAEVYLTAADGYDLRPGPGDPPIVPAVKSAQHVGGGDRPSLTGVLFARGPGLEPGVDLGEIESREVAGLAMDMLGLA